MTLCDIDLFKSYNDHYGHTAGDEALRRVATTIRSALRQADTVYRYRGEEFLAILPEQTIVEAGRAMDRIRKAVEGLDILHPASGLGVVTISVGVAELLDPMGSSDDWLGAADAVLYRAKENGRNRVELEARHSLDALCSAPVTETARINSGNHDAVVAKATTFGPPLAEEDQLCPHGRGPRTRETSENVCRSAYEGVPLNRGRCGRVRFKPA